MNGPFRIDTVFLDAGGVLVHPNWDRVAQVLVRHGIPADGRALFAAEPHVTREIDHPDYFSKLDDEAHWPRFIGSIVSRAGVRFDPLNLASPIAELKTLHLQGLLWETPYEGVGDALAALRRAGYKLAVASNSNGSVVAMFDRLGLAPYFDLVLDSSDVGVEKPDPRFFRIGLERLGSRPETSVHVGDLYHVDVLGARASGMTGVLMDPAGLQQDRDCPRIARLADLEPLLKTQRIS